MTTNVVKAAATAVAAPDAAPVNSSVMRAVASANEHTAMDKVNSQREIADKLEKAEVQNKINKAINESVANEEKRVIEEASRRMAEVHAKKAQEATKAA